MSARKFAVLRLSHRDLELKDATNKHRERKSVKKYNLKSQHYEHDHFKPLCGSATMNMRPRVFSAGAQDSAKKKARRWSLRVRRTDQSTQQGGGINENIRQLIEANQE